LVRQAGYSPSEKLLILDLGDRGWEQYRDVAGFDHKNFQALQWHQIAFLYGLEKSPLPSTLMADPGAKCRFEKMIEDAGWAAEELLDAGPSDTNSIGSLRGYIVGEQKMRNCVPGPIPLSASLLRTNSRKRQRFLDFLRSQHFPPLDLDSYLALHISS
jgi:hypothetical protein